MHSRIDPPGMALRMLESRVVLEAGQLMMQLPLLRLQAKRGAGQPIIVLPGFMTDDNTTIILRHYLNAIGYKASGWRQGINRGRMLAFMPPLLNMIEDLKQKHGQKVILVGWSRGGMIAREIARDHPELIERVITIGSPVKGGVEISSIGRWVKQETGMSPAELNALLSQRQEKLIQVPIKSIYSKLDGIVAWRSCIDEVNPDVEHFEIHGSHMGMGTNVDVFRLLTKLLRD